MIPLERLDDSIREAQMPNNGFDTLSDINKVGYILFNANIVFLTAVSCLTY
jgi:hypothetical protein